MPKLSVFNVRKPSGKVYNLNPLIGVHFNDTNNTTPYIAAFPREAKYDFEDAYEEEQGQISTATWFAARDYTTATTGVGAVFFPQSTTYALCLNTLRANYNPAIPAQWGSDAHHANFAPYGTAEIAQMYGIYRVTSCYFKFRFHVDRESLNSAWTANGANHQQSFTLRIGYYLTTTPTSVPNASTLAEAVIYNKIKTKRWRISNHDINKMTDFILESHVNIKDQFDNDVLAADKFNDATFSGTLGSGPNDEIVAPSTQLYAVPFMFLESPNQGFNGTTEDTSIRILTDVYTKKYCRLTQPDPKLVESST